jgi:magnesium chelatase subunit I
MQATFPFAAIVGQEELKRALMIAAVSPSVGGVLVFGDRGSGKTTTVRAIADLLPPIEAVAGCAYRCPPGDTAGLCAHCAPGAAARRARAPVPFVDLPLGATEDRVTGSLDLEYVLARGERRFEPGLLARAHRGFLYIDEINLLEDHLVDLLLDVAASGENVVEREGLSVRHPARFVLVGSGNPEEGELRPQLLDRFGLSVEVATPNQLSERLEIIRRRDDFERDPVAFGARWSRAQARLRRRIQQARERVGAVAVPANVLEEAARLCIALGTDGLRGELTLMRAARAVASLEDAAEVTSAHLRAIAPSALRHRLRRNPLDDAGSGVRIERAMRELWPT